LRDEPVIVERLRSNSCLLREELDARGFEVPAAETPIIPLIVGDPRAATDLCEAALQAGVFAQAIRPPTVPDGTSRLRLVAMATHSAEDLRTAATRLGVAAGQAVATDRLRGHPGQPLTSY
jgi:glycine C-acetyltransferase/8-amino-7-oxononanoate synthase